MIRLTAKLSTLKLFLVYNFKSLVVKILKDIKKKHCLFCDETTYNTEAICCPCYQDLPWNTHHCSRCALPFPTTIKAAKKATNKHAIRFECGECISAPPPFTATVASFRYETPVDKAIQMLKYHRKQYFATLFTYFLATTIKQSYQGTTLPSCLIPVPMHRSKLKARGFNQAQLISHKLSRLLSIPSNSDILHKIKSTPAQTGLSKIERIRNLKGAFRLTDSVAGLHIALVDDVVTTRATADLLCKLLIDAGAKRVDVWCIARTSKHRN
ncbi:MAG: ComF family protein [Oleiphilaceae bacterium]|jgi:ComF family protein